MKKLILVLLVLIFVMALAAPVFADDNPGPCSSTNDPGNSEFAIHHIVPATPGHVPGSHGGFALCLGTGRLFHQP